MIVNKLGNADQKRSINSLNLINKNKPASTLLTHTDNYEDAFGHLRSSIASQNESIKDYKLLAWHLSSTREGQSNIQSFHNTMETEPNVVKAHGKSIKSKDPDSVRTYE